MDFSDAQRDMGRAYVGGGPGVVVSSLVWVATAFVQQRAGVAAAFPVLFFGGMLIFPLSKLLARVAFRRDSENGANPLGLTALECTIAMIGGLFAAWLFLGTRPMLVMPLAAIAVGTHYLVFKTVYGDRLFWLLGAILTLIGLADIYVAQLRGMGTGLVAATELLFGLSLTLRAGGFGKAG